MCFGGRATCNSGPGASLLDHRCTPAEAHRHTLPLHPAGRWVGYDADSTHAHRIYWQDRSRVSVERNVRFTSNTVTIHVPFHSTSTSTSTSSSNPKPSTQSQQTAAQTPAISSTTVTQQAA